MSDQPTIWLRGHGNHSLAFMPYRDRPMVVLTLPGGSISFTMDPDRLALFVREISDALAAAQQGSEPETELDRNQMGIW